MPHDQNSNFSSRKKEAPSLVIREATDEDWKYVGAWATYSLADSKGIVGVADGQIIAYLQWFQHSDEPGVLVISRLEVQTPFRLSGYGRLMVAYIQDLSPAQKVVAWHVEWEEVPFWEAIGFVHADWEYGDSDYDAGNYECFNP